MKYLLWCANAHIHFKIPELKAIASFYKIPIRWVERKPEAPYVILELNKEEDAINLASQSVLVRSCYEIWGHGYSESELHKSVSQNLDQLKCHLSKAEDFRLNITSFNKKLTTTQKQKKINSFSYIPFKGKVNLEEPKLVLSLIEYYGVNRHSVPEEPLQSFFGRWLVDGQREILHSFSLKRRHFIGTTSMDAELAFLMVNMAQVGPGNIVLDPFVGTGSILVSAAQRGAYVVGWDIDYLTLHAKTKPSRYKERVRKPTESVFANLRQYGLEKRYLDVLVMDSSRSMWRSGSFIDAIVTDPPYGIRESTEKVGCNKRKYNTEEETEKRLPVFQEFPVHFPPKVNYEFADIMADLLNFSALHLRIGGRLVYWLPVFREDYSDDMIPKHPTLQLEFHSEQILSTYSSRRLITMIKTRELKEGECTLSSDLKKIDEFRSKFSEASQNFQSLSKEERRALRKALPMDKRGQGYTIDRNQSSFIPKSCSHSNHDQQSKCIKRVNTIHNSSNAREHNDQNSKYTDQFNSFQDCLGHSTNEENKSTEQVNRVQVCSSADDRRRNNQEIKCGRKINRIPNNSSSQPHNDEKSTCTKQIQGLSSAQKHDDQRSNCNEERITIPNKSNTHTNSNDREDQCTEGINNTHYGHEPNSENERNHTRTYDESIVATNHVMISKDNG